MTDPLADLTPERRAVAEVVLSAPDPVSAKEVAEQVSSSYSSVRNLLPILVRLGVIAKPARGRYWIPAPTGAGKTAAALAAASSLESNAEFVDLGSDSIWVPIYPVSLGAGDLGDVSLDEIEPEGAFPLPGAWARRVGINGSKRPFAVTVRGDSMSKDFPDGAVVFGYRVEEADVEDVYALYYAGDLLVKRVRRLPNGRYQLISSNENYPPIPVRTGDIHIIGRVVGALTTI